MASLDMAFLFSWKGGAVRALRKKPSFRALGLGVSEFKVSGLGFREYPKLDKGPLYPPGAFASKGSAALAVAIKSGSARSPRTEHWRTF